MHAQIHFFPLGNADTLRLDLADGRKILVDYANMRCADDLNDLRCDLPRELWRDLVKARRTISMPCASLISMTTTAGGSVTFSGFGMPSSIRAMIAFIFGNFGYRQPLLSKKKTI